MAARSGLVTSVVAGGGGNPSSPLNVDAMVGNVLGAPARGAAPQAQQRQTPGFKQGGLVQLAAGWAGQAGGEPLLDDLRWARRLTSGRGTPRRWLLRAPIWLPSTCQRESPGAHLINSTVSGRTDRIPMRARTGSFVIPADVVSGLGEGNTMAGAKMWGDLLTHSVTGAAAGGIKRGASPALKGGIGRMGGIRGPGSRQLPAPSLSWLRHRRCRIRTCLRARRPMQDGGLMTRRR